MLWSNNTHTLSSRITLEPPIFIACYCLLSRAHPLHIHLEFQLENPNHAKIYANPSNKYTKHQSQSNAYITHTLTCPASSPGDAKTFAPIDIDTNPQHTNRHTININLASCVVFWCCAPRSLHRSSGTK